MNKKLPKSPTKKTFFCTSINMNLLRIGFNPQIYKEVEIAFNRRNKMTNFPELVYITEVNSVVMLA